MCAGVTFIRLKPAEPPITILITKIKKSKCKLENLQRYNNSNNFNYYHSFYQA